MLALRVLDLLETFEVLEHSVLHDAILRLRHSQHLASIDWHRLHYISQVVLQLSLRDELTGFDSNMQEC